MKNTKLKKNHKNCYAMFLWSVINQLRKDETNKTRNVQVPFQKPHAHETSTSNAMNLLSCCCFFKSIMAPASASTIELSKSHRSKQLLTAHGETTTNFTVVAQYRHQTCVCHWLLSEFIW